MKHRIRFKVPAERRGWLRNHKKAVETRTVWVDDKTYGKIRNEQGRQPYSLEELVFYDEIFDD